jgi:hypothetical protein
LVNFPASAEQTAVLARASRNCGFCEMLFLGGAMKRLIIEDEKKTVSYLKKGLGESGLPWM